METNQNIDELVSKEMPSEIYILDAPGINGMGSGSYEPLKKHIENGGKIIHKARLDCNGSIELFEPHGMWPNQQVK